MNVSNTNIFSVEYDFNERNLGRNFYRVLLVTLFIQSVNDDKNTFLKYFLKLSSALLVFVYVRQLVFIYFEAFFRLHCTRIVTNKTK